jgi:PPE-repeat protein
MKIKGFDKNLCCRGMQYEIGKEFKTDAENITANDLCSGNVLHYCDSLQNVNNYYSCTNDDNRYCEIEVLGKEVTDGEKFGSNHIKIIREITGHELKLMKGLERGNTGVFNSGDLNSGDLNSGYRNSGYRNSGDRNSGDLNSGDRNSGNRNSGTEIVVTEIVVT